MRLMLVISAIFLSAYHSVARADPAAGAEVFFSSGCIGCHAIECNRAGPRLGGLIGRPAGSVGDFTGYSEAMKESDIVWTEETLDAFLADPAGFIPGNGMAGSAGKLEDAQARRDLINFLKAPDTSMDLCG